MSYSLPIFLNGAQNFIIALVLSAALLALFKRIYQAITPYNERVLIAEGNKAAAVALAGSMIGFALPMASALTVTVDRLEFVMWAVLAGVVQILAFLILRRFIVDDIKGKIEAGNMAVAIYLAATAIAIGLLNAASMTY